jgi:excinuclease ABC subunit A
MTRHQTRHHITVKGARQNNLKNLNLKIPLGELVVVTGVSGSGKSSLAFDTIYAEGQRRYVETFSPYARQFLDRMDKPQVDEIDGIPPAIAIDQTNPVRTSRSTVGTMTELNDHIKLLFARAAALYCTRCGAPVRRDTPESIYRATQKGALARAHGIMIVFPVAVPHNFTAAEIKQLLARQGYERILRETAGELVPPELELRSLKFRGGRSFELRGIGTQEQIGKVTDYNEALSEARVEGELLFSRVRDMGSRIRDGEMGPQTVHWHFECELKQYQVE